MVAVVAVTEWVCVRHPPEAPGRFVLLAPEIHVNSRALRWERLVVLQVRRLLDTPEPTHGLHPLASLLFQL